MDPAALAAGVPWDFETFPEYLASVARHGTVLNFAAYIGHTALRLYVMGDEAVDRPADDPTRSSAMVGDRRDAMDAGAAGLRHQLRRHPPRCRRHTRSRAAGPTATELEALVRAVGRTGRGVIGVNGGRQPVASPTATTLQHADRHPLHLHRRADVPERRAPQGRSRSTARAGPTARRCGRR